MEKHTTFTIKVNEANFSHFSHLLQQGFNVKIAAGSTIKNMLCDQFHVETDYLKNMSGALPSFVRYMQKDEKEIQYEQLNNLNWSEESEYVFFRVLVQTGNL